MNDGFDALGELGLGVEQRKRAFDFRRPDEAKGARGSLEFSFGDEALEGARDFENGDAAAGVIVGAGALMIEVAAEGDFFLSTSDRRREWWR